MTGNMITLLKDDYGTPIVVHAKSNGKVIPLIGSEVYFDFVFKSTNKKIGGGLCEVVDATLGMVKYTFKAGELTQTGEYQGRVRIELSQGAKREGVALDFIVVDPTAPKS